LSLYEVVSSTVNPFIGDKNNPMNEKIAEIEKKMNELGTKNPELPLNLIEDMETKFKGLENNIVELKKTVESKAIDENALVEKVILMVVDQLKPQSRNKPIYSGMPQQSYQVQQPNQMIQQASHVQQPPRAVQPPYATTEQQAAQYFEEENGQGVRLSFLDNRPETSIILLNWIEFLMEKVDEITCSTSWNIIWKLGG